MVTAMPCIRYRKKYEETIKNHQGLTDQQAQIYDALHFDLLP